MKTSCLVVPDRFQSMLGSREEFIDNENTVRFEDRKKSNQNNG